MMQDSRRAKAEGAAAHNGLPEPSIEHRYPNFICAGAQKAATTWLHVNLRGHPDIWLPPVKELHYFNAVHLPSNRRWTLTGRRIYGVQALEHYLVTTPAEKRDYNYIARVADIIGGPISDDWYGRIFSLAKPDQVCGEIAPDYATLPKDGIAHIVRLMPDVRIILTLRDPIERNWSHIRMIAQRGNISELSKLEQIARYPDVAQRADYPAMLSNWTAGVPEEQLLTLFMDDVVSEPLQALERICTFIGVKFDSAHFGQAADPVHVGEPMDIPPPIYKLLRQQLAPVYDRIAELYPRIGAAWRARHY